MTAPDPFSDPSYGSPAVLLKTGIPPSRILPFPNFDPGQYPQPGVHTTQAPLVWYDQNAGRPARQMQWSIGLQREVVRDLVVEAAYVANRGVWWNSPGLIDVNGLTLDRLQAAGIDLNSTADQAILRAQIGTTAAGRFQNRLPYSNFPTTATVAQSLRPFPQFSSITSLWSPLGKTWYDSLQTKATKRLSYGLNVTSTFTWQKNLALGAPSNVVVPGTGGVPLNDVYNREQNKYLSPFDQPRVFNLAVNYVVPGFRFGDNVAAKTISWAARDWALNAFLQYASGIPIQAPLAQNNLNNLLLRNGTSLSYANRVPGQALFLQDLNCHCFDPNKEFVLNRAAWVEPAAGQFGTSASYYNDYRFQRRPVENFGVGRIFRFTERMNLNVRVEFSNIFNRAQMPNPVVNNASQTQQSTNGRPTAGFGFINTATVGATTPRQGTIVGRFQF